MTRLCGLTDLAPVSHLTTGIRYAGSSSRSWSFYANWKSQPRAWVKHEGSYPLMWFSGSSTRVWKFGAFVSQRQPRAAPIHFFDRRPLWASCRRAVAPGAILKPSVFTESGPPVRKWAGWPGHRRRPLGASDLAAELWQSIVPFSYAYRDAPAKPWVSSARHHAPASVTNYPARRRDCSTAMSCR